MSGYSPGEQPRNQRFIKLNTNENPYPPSSRVLEAIRAAADERLRVYPDPTATEFREAASKVLGVPPDWILACNGSDEGLTMLTRACLGADDLMAAPTPSYPLYKVLADIQGCRYVERPFSDDWRLPKDFRDGARLAFVPNPNSPTATRIEPEELLDHARRSDGLVVSDEAYADFGSVTCLGLIEQCERLVVLRTLSKAYSLAGVRFGFIVAQPSVIGVLRKVKDSYNCDALSIAAAAAAIGDQTYFHETRRRILATRARLESGLARLGFDVTPSHANFVWIRHSRPVKPVYEALKERKILVRYLDYPDYGDGLRVTVGTDAEIDQFLAALEAIVG